MLGAVAGLVGGILANVFTAILAEKFIGTHFDFDWLALLAVVALVSALLANVAGWLASSRILEPAAARSSTRPSNGIVTIFPK